MNIVVLDRESIGFDTPLTSLYRIGNVEIFNSTKEDEISERIKDADVVIINKIKFTDSVIAAANRLKLICVFATGYDNIDIDSAKRHGVAVCNVPSYSTGSVTACTVASVLALLTRLRQYNDYVISGKYSEYQKPNLLSPVFHDMTGKVWGIIGCGEIGSSVARVALALGATVITHQRHPHEIYDTVTVDELCQRSDIITIHCPLNSESREMINQRRIALMKRDVILVNAARGAVLNERDVSLAIKNGEIGAFGCDVYTVEPFGISHPYNDIKDLPNVLLTPHCAWGSFEARCKCIGIICENISAFFDGKILNRVDI